MTIKSKSLLILAAMLVLALLLGAGIVHNTVINLREADRLKITLDYLGWFIDIREDMSLLMDSTTDCMLQDVPDSRTVCNTYMDRIKGDLDFIYNYVEEHREQFLNYDQRIRELEIIRSFYAELADSIRMSHDILDRDGLIPAFNYFEYVLEPRFENKLLIMVSDSIKRGSREMESSYLQLLLYTNVIPIRWRKDDTEVVSLNNAIENLINVNNTDMNIHVQIDLLKDYLISRDEKYKLEFLESSDDVWLAFNSWLEIVNMQKALRVEGEDDNLRQVLQIIHDFNDFERIGIEIAGLVDKGDMKEAFRMYRDEYDSMMDGKLQKGIHHAAEDVKEEMTEAYRAIRRKTLVAAAEILSLLMIVVAALSAILINFILGFTRSLKELGTATGEIGKGNLDYRSGLSTKDELGDLSRFLDSMASDLKNATVSRDYASGIIDAMPEALI
ncbi:MAG TPA: HAMP domain-containing protein, partial [Nitrospirae bacterium]|nr:HAMP domain-containing protein [Nitrospirota bacterium]